MNVKLLTEHHLESLSLKGGCTGSSESTIVKMSRCWKSHVVAQIVFLYPAFLKSVGYYVIPSIQKWRSSVRPSVRLSEARPILYNDCQHDV